MADKDIENIIEKYTRIVKERKLIVKDIFEGEKLLTETIGNRISSGYAAIEMAISNLDSKDPDMGQKKHDLQQLKRHVPIGFAVTEEQRILLNKVLNDLVGVNSSDAKL